MNDFILILFYLLFVVPCLFILPCWAWFKRKRKILGSALAVLGLWSGYSIYGYFTDPAFASDSGSVVFGFLVLVAPFTFLIQLLIYIAYKIVAHIGSKPGSSRRAG